jgi:hypothetical protein
MGTSAEALAMTTNVVIAHWFVRVQSSECIPRTNIEKCRGKHVVPRGGFSVSAKVVNSPA